jgi:hypothetical protein
MTPLLLLAAPALAASLEVQPGDDIVTLTASLGAGDEVVFADGTYTIAGTLEWTGAGTESSPIVLRAAEGASPVIQGSDIGSLVDIEAATYIEVRGLTFEGAQAWYDSGNWFAGMRIADSSEITVEDCVIRKTTAYAMALNGNNTGLHILHNELGNTAGGQGIYVGCGDGSCGTTASEIANNWIHDIGGDWTVGIHVEPLSYGNRIADNVVYNVISRGIQVESTEYSDANVVEGNAVWSVGDAGIGVYGAAIVRNNLIFNVDGRGIRSGMADDRVLEKVVITHNTIVNTTGWGVELDNWAGNPGMVFANNAITNATGYAFQSDEGHLDANNYLRGNVFTGLVEGLTAFPEAFVPGGGMLDYHDAVGWDFYPTADAILVDAGDAAGDAWVPETDFNGNLRDGEFPDVGAYEVVAGSNPGWVIQEGFKEVGDGTIDGAEVGSGCCKKKEKAEGSDAAIALVPLIFALRRRRRS